MLMKDDVDIVSGVEDVRGQAAAREAAARGEAQHGVGSSSSDGCRGGQVI